MCEPKADQTPDLRFPPEDERHTRRYAMSVMGVLFASGSGLLASCGGGGGGASANTAASTTSSSTSASASTSSSASSTSSATGTCTTLPSETNGPYPGDGSNTVNGSLVNVLTQSGVVRSDIRTSFGSMSGTAPGVPLTITITVRDNSLGCTSLANRAVYIWHCTRDGLYSLYNSTVLTQNYLRGVQVTDANGQCTFTTIFPGCYSGRMPHIHVEVYDSLAAATSNANVLRTSQFAFDRTICQTVYNNAAGYSASISNLAAITFASDNVFNDNSTAELAAATVALSGDVTNGYTGTVTMTVP
jgi:protocatechuate 3,4-dioxygenase beta subunit